MVRNCRLKIGCWISGHRETAERIITMKLGYLEFVEVLSKQLLNALNLQEQQIFFKKKAIDNKDRLFVEAFENSSGKQLCGIDVKDLYERCMEGSSMESILYSVQEEIEKGWESLNDTEQRFMKKRLSAEQIEALQQEWVTANEHKDEAEQLTLDL